MKQRNFAVLCLLFMVLAAIFSGCSLKVGHGPQQADPPTDVQTTVTTTSAQGTSPTTERTTASAETTVSTTERSEITSETTVLTTERSEPTEVPTEPSEPLALDGTWCSVRRVGETLEEDDLVFFPDGTGYSGSCVYDNIHYQPFPDAVPDEGGWYPQPMGYPLTYFTYSLQDGKLTLTITGDDFEDYSVPITETYAFEQIDADCFRLDNRYGTYVRADGASLKELCEILNVAYSVS
ncbi:MAG: hypothetical protein E7452_02590 [Ruminococcaceae bacterium]|nr:hypothetical protein [Oscillospiraceae bacterium]